MRRRPFVAITVGALALLPAGLAAESAVVKRNVNLRTGPSTSFTILRLLLPGDELTFAGESYLGGDDLKLEMSRD